MIRRRQMPLLLGAAALARPAVAAFTASEKERWGKIIHRANIKLE